MWRLLLDRLIEPPKKSIEVWSLGLQIEICEENVMAHFERIKY